MSRNIRILRGLERLEMDVDLDIPVKVAHVERDDKDYVTIYGTVEHGELYYFVLSQDLIDQIKSL